jgi:hypothetical protein
MLCRLPRAADGNGRNRRVRVLQLDETDSSNIEDTVPVVSCRQNTTMMARHVLLSGFSEEDGETKFVSRFLGSPLPLSRREQWQLV